MLHGVLAVGVEQHGGQQGVLVDLRRHRDGVAQPLAQTQFLQFQVVAYVFHLLGHTACRAIDVGQRLIGEVAVHFQVLRRLGAGVVHHEIFDARHHVGVEMRDGLETRGVDLQFLELFLALQALHGCLVASALIPACHHPASGCEQQSACRPHRPSCPPGLRRLDDGRFGAHGEQRLGVERHHFFQSGQPHGAVGLLGHYGVLRLDDGETVVVVKPVGVARGEVVAEFCHQQAVDGGGHQIAARRHVQRPDLVCRQHGQLVVEALDLSIDHGK